jgi:hypothetical protein
MHAAAGTTGLEGTNDWDPVRHVGKRLAHWGITRRETNRRSKDDSTMYSKR